MSEEPTEGNGINPVAKWLVGGAAALVVAVTIYGVMNSGITITPPNDGGASAGNAINLDKLREEAEPKPTPYGPFAREPVRLLEPQLPPVATPTPQAAMDPMTQWRLQKRMKALEAPVMVAAFDDHRVKEIPSTGQNKAAVSQLHPPASPYTIMEGSRINAVLINAINSDFPSPITAQVEQPVYDTATGGLAMKNLPLIPQGTKVIGSFDRPHGPLADRIAIHWHRLIFPDMSTLDLPQMPSTDAHGFGGLTGDVNSHHLAALGAGALMTVLSIGPAIGSVFAMNNNNQNSYDPNQELAMMMAGSAGSQASSHASTALQPYLTRPKTISIAAGALLEIFVTTDLILPGPYIDHAGVTPVSARH